MLEANMCGRIALFTPPARMARLLDAQLDARVDPDARASWNVAPSLDVLALRAPRPDVGERPKMPKTPKHSERELTVLHWGLVPYWAKDPKIGNRMINARSETLAERPAFRNLLERRRCLVVADGFYEWRHPQSTSQKDIGKGRARKRGTPFFFQRADGEPMVLAGLWDSWRDRTRPEDDPDAILRTCTIITTAASSDVEDIHDRMPVIVERPDIDRWLDRHEQDVTHVMDVMQPSRQGLLARRPVSHEVNNPDNDGPELIEEAPDEDSPPEGPQDERLF